jgi:hypothetical protein
LALGGMSWVVDMIMPVSFGGRWWKKSSGVSGRLGPLPRNSGRYTDKGVRVVVVVDWRRGSGSGGASEIWSDVSGVMI